MDNSKFNKAGQGLKLKSYAPYEKSQLHRDRSYGLFVMESIPKRKHPQQAAPPVKGKKGTDKGKTFGIQKMR